MEHMSAISVLIAQVVFLIECGHTHRHTESQMPLITQTHASAAVGMSNNHTMSLISCVDIESVGVGSVDGTAC